MFTVKPVQNDYCQKNVFKTNYRLMQDENNAECSPLQNDPRGAFCSTMYFRPSLGYTLSLTPSLPYISAHYMPRENKAILMLL